jgi:protein-disulfide isomerase
MHPYAVSAAEAAECAAQQGKYQEMHDLLFAKQRELPTADYAAYARGLGLDVSRMKSCLATHEKLNKVIADKTLAERLGARATPTFFIGRIRQDGGIDLKKRLNGALDVNTVLEMVTKM